MGMAALLIVVRGDPVTQGSKRARPARRKGAGGEWVYTGKVAMVESGDDHHKERLKSWRQDVVANAAEAMAGREAMAGAVAIRATFTLKRPRGHYGTGRNAQMLKPSAPAFPAGKDWDKLARAVGDALKAAGVYGDDSQVTDAHVAKRYQLPAMSMEGTAGLAQVGDPTLLCGVVEADVLRVPGVVIRVWQMVPAAERFAPVPVESGGVVSALDMDAHGMPTGVLW
jgi:Holliday junction resolvase RusA-like endonuclease